MKKILLCFLFLLVSRFSYSQFYLGWNFTQVLKVASADKTLSAVTQDELSGHPVLTWYNNTIKAVIVVHFNNDVAEKYTIVHDDLNSVTATMQYFDEKFIKVSYSKWKFIKDNRMTFVDLLKLDDKQFMFVFHR